MIVKEIYNKLPEESFEEINNLDKNVDTNKLVFKYKARLLIKILLNLIMLLLLSIK